MNDWTADAATAAGGRADGWPVPLPRLLREVALNELPVENRPPYSQHHSRIPSIAVLIAALERASVVALSEPIASNRKGTQAATEQAQSDKTLARGFAGGASSCSAPPRWPSGRAPSRSGYRAFELCAVAEVEVGQTASTTTRRVVPQRRRQLSSQHGLGSDVAAAKPRSRLPPRRRVMSGPGRA